MSQRTDRIDELLRQELSAILARDLADPGLGFATITEVETGRDLRHARVWVSVIGQPAERDATVAALARAMPYARRMLGERLRLKRIPQLHVRLDDSVARGARVLRILDEIESGRTPEDLPAPGESLPTPVRGTAPTDDLGDPDASGDGDPPEAGRPSRRPRPNRRDRQKPATDRRRAPGRHR